MCLMHRTEKGAQAREFSKCLNGRSYGERLAKDAFLSPATRGSKKDSDRAVTPAAEAVPVPAHLVPPESPQAKQLCQLHAQPSLGRVATGQKKRLVSMHMGSLLSSSTLQPCGLWPARLVCWCGGGGGWWQGSPGKSIGAYWPVSVAIPF